MAIAKKILVLIVSFAVLSSTGLACYGYNKLDLIKVDTLNLKRTDLRDQDTCYAVQIDFDVPTNGFQTALSISNFYELRTFQGFDYNIRGNNRKGTNVLAISVIVSQRTQWSTLSVTYLVSARNDIYAGSFLADAYPQFDCASRTTRNLKFNALVPSIQSGFQHQVIIFISGLKCRDSLFNFKFTNQKYNGVTQTLEIAAVSDAFPFIEYVQINYVIYRVNSDFAISYAPAAIVKDYDYLISTTNCFTKAEPEFLSLVILADRLKGVGGGCKSKCYNTKQCLAEGGRKFGRECVICGRYERFQGSTCIPNCNSETEEYNPLNFECVCKPGCSRNGPYEPCRFTCGPNQVWNGKCMCRSGFGRFGGICTPCPPNSASTPTEQCICNPGFFFNQRKKTCDQNFCPANSVPVQTGSGNYECKCMRPNHYYNPYRKVCEEIECPANSRLELTDKGWVCNCKEGLFFNTRTRTCDFLAPCGEYAYPNYNGRDWVCICKSDCYSVGNTCRPIPICPPNAKFNVVTQRCECVVSGEHLHNGICRPCRKHEQYNNELSKFICINGYTYYGEVCGPQCSEYQEFFGDGCVCKPNCYYSAPKRCSPCPPNSRPDPFKAKCICDQGFFSDENGYCQKRVIKCPHEGMEVSLTTGQCQCNGYIDSGKCRQIPKCPIKSKWNQQKLRCDCTVVGEYLIDNQCQSCKANQGWNGKQCACATGFFKIDGVCRTCHPNSYYNNKECLCNLGFFGDGKDKCEKCHSSCGRCVGPREDQCTMCSDVSYTLAIKGEGCGVCTRNSGCPLGLYKEKGQCRPCSSYCSQCISQQICKTCIPGFQINTMEHEKKTYSYCVQICGDGKRFQLDCDDGNTKNGDGCNSQCQVQEGWHCQGGSTVRPSTCVCYTPSRSFITLSGAVHLFGKVAQGVRLSYIPPALTANDCMDCHKLLWVRVVSSAVIPGVRVNYIPKSKYQFLTQFDFNGLFAIPVFTISVQINPDFKQYFSQADLAQIEIKAIDPSLLAKVDEEKKLDLDDQNQVVNAVFNQA